MVLYEAFKSAPLRYYGNALLKEPTEKRAKEYIKKYFNNRGKVKVFNIALSNTDLEESEVLTKSIHTFSAFILGFHMRSIVDTELLDKIKDSLPDWTYEFEYTWFITCLYHDAISGIETKKQVKQDLSYSVFKGVMNEFNLPKIPFTFEEMVVKNYYKYRVKEMKKFDHGILGGFLLFKKLVQNYNEKYKEEEKNNHNTRKEYFETNHNGRILIWEKNHLWHFAYIANAIIAHNICFAVKGKKTADVYKELGLERLIVNKENDNRIKLEEDPLVFFLALIDTIEPVKYFDKLNPKFVWKHISINFNKEKNKVVIKGNENIFDMKKWYDDKIKDLSNWLCIKEIKPPHNGKITIEF